MADPTPQDPSPTPTPLGRPVDRTDRRRLEQVQAQDLTESRLNQEFVDWLKTRGLNWLLVALLAICGLMGWNIWKDRKAQSRSTAWAEFDDAATPVALQDIAAMHGSVDALGGLALLRAADQYLASVISGRRFDRAPDAEDVAMTPELSEEWLRSAGDLYARAETEARARASSIDTSGILISALFGRAAVAESQGNVDAARSALTAARDAATERFDPLAQLAARRLETLDRVEGLAALPARAALPRPGAGISTPPTIIDDQLLQELLAPKVELRRMDGPPPVELPASTLPGGASPPTPAPESPGFERSTELPF